MSDRDGRPMIIMQKFLVISFCSIFALHAMEQLPDGIAIRKAGEKDIPAMTELSNEVINDFLKPIVYLAYAEYGEEKITQFCNEVDIYYQGFFKRVTES